MSPSERDILLMQLANELDDYRDLAGNHAANADERIAVIRQCGQHQVEMAEWLGVSQWVLLELARQSRIPNRRFGSDSKANGTKLGSSSRAEHNFGTSLAVIGTSGTRRFRMVGSVGLPKRRDGFT